MYNCLRNDFYEWHDPDRGNCFTFNHKKAAVQHESLQAGQTNGTVISIE